MIKNRLNPRYLAALLALVFVLGGCAQLSMQTDQPRTADVALSLSDQAGSVEEAQRYLLKTADRFQSEGMHEEARIILRSQQLATPVEALKDLYFLLAMRGVTSLEDRAWAGELAEALNVTQFAAYREDLIDQALNLQLQVYELAGRPLNIALTLISQAAASQTADAQQLNDRIWQALKRTPDSTLSDEGQSAIGYDTQGWLELAVMLREPGLTPEDQSQAIRDWQYNWTGHPAASLLPSELALITLLAQQRPERIVLALPLSGPLAGAGAAIRDGFMAAFYHDETTADLAIEISVTDTYGQPFNALYDQLAKDSPDLIVGPLEKEALSAVFNRNAMPVPLLALNYDDSGKRAPARLYQYGLSAEDEARQIAERLNSEGLHQTLVLIPSGGWGDRFEKALQARVNETSGTILHTERFFPEDNLREVSADILGINVSRQRAIQVEQTIGQDVEFEPRRRQDVDAIILVAQPTIARQFKPLFAFYFGGDLPVYSPSLVYEGRPDPSRDRDLDQIRFTDLPWVLDEKNEFRSAIHTPFPGMSGQIGRLFAMGADAFHLSTQLPLLDQVDGSSLEGQTGTLKMTQDGRIQRTQRWAYFNQGTPKLLPDVPLLSEEGTNTNQEAEQ
ncbi:penicillin-binding protein activator [Marinobacter changyiensis]|uniref:penicillin-binding protein activator n=1 Tax=Marinobacter changyiensis TaxID=2604091 RepID=UPI001265834D|nr:penicillin-binding protein activator [Marinobacter changyiensis]